jgi:hypothetical protein
MPIVTGKNRFGSATNIICKKTASRKLGSQWVPLQRCRKSLQQQQQQWQQQHTYKNNAQLTAVNELAGNSTGQACPT